MALRHTLRIPPRALRAPPFVPKGEMIHIRHRAGWTLIQSAISAITLGSTCAGLA
jgi:hypothetical protein